MDVTWDSQDERLIESADAVHSKPFDVPQLLSTVQHLAGASPTVFMGLTRLRPMDSVLIIISHDGQCLDREVPLCEPSQMRGFLLMSVL
jgi:hypothetical protein